jgi:hypothetical protein
MAADAPSAMPSRNVMLIGWDGCHRDHVTALLKEDRLPNLKHLIAEGALVKIEVTSGATDTKAGWTQILTGYKPAVTGVYNNRRYQDVPAGLSVFERLKAHFGAEKFAAVAVIGKKQHCGEINPPSKTPVDPSAEAPAAAAGKQAAAVGTVVEENLTTGLPRPIPGQRTFRDVEWRLRGEATIAAPAPRVEVEVGAPPETQTPEGDPE